MVGVQEEEEEEEEKKEEKEKEEEESPGETAAGRRWKQKENIKLNSKKQKRVDV